MTEWFYRLAATGVVPRRWFAPELPEGPPPPPAPGPLSIEIVSHCWLYHRFLAYQLSSLALYPPRDAAVTMTVFFSHEDRETSALLDRFGATTVPGVRWNWQPLETGRLFRRAIGRDLAARASTADWVWFSDCDVVFHEGALDAAAATLRGRDDLLVFPPEHRVSEILASDDPLLASAGESAGLVRIDPAEFHAETREKAVGGFQIVRGDVARAAGYCGTIPHYMRPVERWSKTYEDRTFRWLLGTHGTPVHIPGLYRLRHAVKGRDPASEEVSLRSLVRRLRQGPARRSPR
jgi:hypothetical protein